MSGKPSPAGGKKSVAQSESAVDTGDINSRRSPRRGFKRPVGLLVKGAYHVLQGMQISEGGLMVQGALELHPNEEKVVVTLLLPDGGYAVTRAEPVYEMNNGGPDGVSAYGLKFVELPLQKKRLIRNYISAKTAEEAESDAHSAAAEGPEN